MRTNLRIMLIAVTLLVWASTTLNAQGGPRQMEDRYKQIEAQRIAFITSELALTPDEARVFWPIYNEYNEKRNKLMIRHRHHHSEDRSLSQLSEKDLMEIAEADISNMEEMAALRREYHEKFKQILPIIKVIKLYGAERDFSRKLFMERGESKQGRGQN
jgi:hypothetical protein